LREKATQVANDYTKENSDAEKLAEALASKKQAEDDLVLIRSEAQEMQARYHHFDYNLDGDKARKITWQRYTNEMSMTYGIKLRNQLLAAAERSGIRINSTVKVDAPPQVPENLTLPTSGFLKPVTGGNLKVDASGSFANFLTFFDELNRPVPDPNDPSQSLNILFVVGSDLKFDGYSPDIKTSFTVTPYLIARFPPDKLTTPPQAGAPAAAAAPGAEGAPAGGTPAGGAPGA
jgi:hypothetical protein